VDYKKSMKGNQNGAGMKCSYDNDGANGNKKVAAKATPGGTVKAKTMKSGSPKLHKY
jgi:hypothetical protein